MGLVGLSQRMPARDERDERDESRGDFWLRRLEAMDLTMLSPGRSNRFRDHDSKRVPFVPAAKASFWFLQGLCDKCGSFEDLHLNPEALCLA